MSFSALHNDKLRRIVMHPLAVTILIFCRIPIESGVPCVVVYILASEAVKFQFLLHADLFKAFSIV